MIYHNLNATKALIWRIVHYDNLPWILDNGLHCANSPTQARSYVTIGNAELIEERKNRIVPIKPGGTLADYVPFYFTPFSPMMYNIHTGRGEVTKRRNEEICILVSSLSRAKTIGLQFVFTDRHAYLSLAQYFNDIKELSKIDWPMLQIRNFERDPDDPEKFERYQAEALIHKHLPIEGLLGIVCYTEEIKIELEVHAQQRSLALNIQAMPRWYF